MEFVPRLNRPLTHSDYNSVYTILHHASDAEILRDYIAAVSWPRTCENWWIEECLAAHRRAGISDAVKAFFEAEAGAEAELPMPRRGRGSETGNEVMRDRGRDNYTEAKAKQIETVRPEKQKHEESKSRPY